jgi:hypothetical protein
MSIYDNEMQLSEARELTAAEVEEVAAGTETCTGTWTTYKDGTTTFTGTCTVS